MQSIFYTSKKYIANTRDFCKKKTPSKFGWTGIWEINVFGLKNALKKFQKKISESIIICACLHFEQPIKKSKFRAGETGIFLSNFILLDKLLRKLKFAMNSDQLISDINNGEIASFKIFFESFHPSLCLFANKYLKDPDASSDIVQDAFIYIWSRREELQSISSAKSYLFKYVKNRSLNYLRDNELRSKINYELLSSEVFFRDTLIEEETYQIIYEAVRNLPPQGQKVIELSLDGLKNQEIADQLNITINTVKTIKLRAFNSMRKELKSNVFVLFMLSKLMDN